jgi:alpha-galactosidase
MAKIAIIGAGSIIFATTLLNDMLATKCLEGSTYALMDPSSSKLEKVENWAKKCDSETKYSF